ncbi:MAG: caspase family protein [Leptolyngbya sp. SIOISBB]|nr:caspase family protein [Leptolyngbya sp. SIOISBB]
MRKAFIVGINYYEYGPSLYGCVNDAQAVAEVLERNEDGSINFDVRLMVGNNSTEVISRAALKDSVEELFRGDSEIALFYFAGHGHIEAVGGYLLASDSRRGDEGLSLTDILTLANKSKAQNKIIVLDSCHSGIAGDMPSSESDAFLSDGLTILTASSKEQYASEQEGRGVFTTLFVDALNGVASNLVGDVSPGGIYAYIDQSLGAWEQRPVFKTNVRKFVSIRKVSPTIELSDIRRITEFFPSPGFQYSLDPTFEPERNSDEKDMPVPILENTQKFSILQKYNRVNLVVPVDAPHMWHAAMQSKSCKLTVLGEHYRRLVERGRI